MEFEIHVGKQTAKVTVMLTTLYQVTFKDSVYLFSPENHGHKITWVEKTGKLPAATVKAIGKAIEGHVK